MFETVVLVVRSLTCNRNTSPATKPVGLMIVVAVKAVPLEVMLLTALATPITEVAATFGTGGSKAEKVAELGKIWVSFWSSRTCT